MRPLRHMVSLMFIRLAVIFSQYEMTRFDLQRAKKQEIWYYQWVITKDDN